MSKFGALAASVEDTFKVELIDPVTDLPLVDAAGNAAYIEVLSADSVVGREFDKSRRKAGMQRAMRGRNQLLAQDDPIEENQEKLAKLTKAWRLVDPNTREVIDVPCTEQNALELFSAGEMQWIYRQVWAGANETANFIKRAAKTSTSSQNTNSASTGS